MRFGQRIHSHNCVIYFTLINCPWLTNEVKLLSQQKMKKWLPLVQGNNKMLIVMFCIWRQGGGDKKWYHYFGSFLTGQMWLRHEYFSFQTDHFWADDTCKTSKLDVMKTKVFHLPLMYLICIYIEALLGDF